MHTLLADFVHGALGGLAVGMLLLALAMVLGATITPSFAGGLLLVLIASFMIAATGARANR